MGQSLSLMKSLFLCHGFPGGNNEEAEIYTSRRIYCSWWPEQKSQSHVRTKSNNKVKTPRKPGRSTMVPEQCPMPGRSTMVPEQCPIGSEPNRGQEKLARKPTTRKIRVANGWSAIMVLECEAWSAHLQLPLLYILFTEVSGRLHWNCQRKYLNTDTMR
ncbi:hypothetical protein XELAEV_18009757mg [Xenopus laevis]|uniref:Uncharacterized protein n=1 Tax=Xenopus laevis TaxID=8355 RepID=A0A974DSX0_XENLA|nr:hypothetical protein XELAEV_18009757mg [Xenopus laevis]